MRQFTNICNGYFKRKKYEQNNYLLGVRKIMYAGLLPYNKNLKEQDLFSFDWEKETSVVDLEQEIKEVEAQRAYWDKVDQKDLVFEKGL